MPAILLLAALTICFSVPAFSQAVRVDIPLQTYGPNVPTAGGPQPQAVWVANAIVSICSHPSATIGACNSNPITTYTDSTFGTACPSNAQLVQLPGTTCTAKAGTAGNIGFWYAGGLVDYWIQGPYGTYGPFSVTGGGGSGSGNVSGQADNVIPLAGAATAITKQSHLDENTPGFDTFSQPVQVADGTGEAGAYISTAGPSPTALAGKAFYSSDTSGNSIISDNGGNYSRVQPMPIAPAINSIVGNGTTDDSTAIQAILNGLGSGGRIGMVPSFSRACDLQVTTNAELIGSGNTGWNLTAPTGMNCATPGSSIFHMVAPGGDTSVNQNGGILKNLWLNDSSGSHALTSGVWVDTTNHAQLKNLNLTNMGIGIWNYVQPSGGTSLDASYNVFEDIRTRNVNTAIQVDAGGIEVRGGQLGCIVDCLVVNKSTAFPYSPTRVYGTKIEPSGNNGRGLVLNAGQVTAIVSVEPTTGITGVTDVDLTANSRQSYVHAETNKGMFGVRVEAGALNNDVFSSGISNGQQIVDEGTGTHYIVPGLAEYFNVANNGTPSGVGTAQTLVPYSTSKNAGTQSITWGNPQLTIRGSYEDVPILGTGISSDGAGNITAVLAHFADFAVGEDVMIDGTTNTSATARAYDSNACTITSLTNNSPIAGQVTLVCLQKDVAIAPAGTGGGGWVRSIPSGFLSASRTRLLFGQGGYGNSSSAFTPTDTNVAAIRFDSSDGATSVLYGTGYTPDGNTVNLNTAYRFQPGSGFCWGAACITPQYISSSDIVALLNAGQTWTASQTLLKPGTSLALKLAEANTATNAPLNFGSNILALCGSYWNGSAATQDCINQALTQSAASTSPNVTWQLTGVSGVGSNFAAFGSTSLPFTAQFFASPRFYNSAGTFFTTISIPDTANRAITTPDGNSSTVMVTALTTTAAASDNVTVTGMTSSGHCQLTPTNASAATNIATTYVSAKTTNQITVTHTATANMVYDVMCTSN